MGVRQEVDLDPLPVHEPDADHALPDPEDVEADHAARAVRELHAHTRVALGRSAGVPRGDQPGVPMNDGEACWHAGRSICWCIQERVGPI